MVYQNFRQICLVFRHLVFHSYSLKYVGVNAFLAPEDHKGSIKVVYFVIIELEIEALKLKISFILTVILFSSY